MSLVDALFVLAQHGQDAPDSGAGAGLIVLGVVIALAIAAGIAFVVTRASRRSRGGVEAAPDERRRGDPPFEGIERDR
jgi:hypothetical protein